MNVIFSPLEAGFSFEHLSWWTSDMTSLRFTKTQRVRAWGPLRFMVNPQFESKLMRIKVREITEKKGKPLKIWLLEGRRWYKMMTCFNDPGCIWYGVWGFYLKMDAGCFLVRFGCNPLRFNEMFVFLNLGIMMLNLSEKIYVLFYPCLFPAVFGIPIDLKEPCPNYDGYDRFSFFLHFFNLYDVDFGG